MDTMDLAELFLFHDPQNHFLKQNANVRMSMKCTEVL